MLRQFVFRLVVFFLFRATKQAARLDNGKIVFNGAFGHSSKTNQPLMSFIMLSIQTPIAPIVHEK
jgi:hypothetical protein